MKALVVIGFKTGGRISEILSCQKSMFAVESDKIVVSNMPLLKRWKKSNVVIECIRCGEINSRFLVECKRCGANLVYGGKKHFVTKKLDLVRQDFFWPIREQLNDLIVERLDFVDGQVFPSPYKIGSPYTRDWAYKQFQSVGAKLHLKLWNHWLRAQRAHQLVEEYKFNNDDLMEFFAWVKAETAHKYSKRWKPMADKMGVKL